MARFFGIFGWPSGPNLGDTWHHLDATAWNDDVSFMLAHKSATRVKFIVLKSSSHVIGSWSLGHSEIWG